MSEGKWNKFLTYSIAAIWLINGLCCKVLNLVPRHQQIVAGIIGENHSRILTLFIGLSEIAMAVWILSGFRSRLNAISQMIIIAVMNAIEYFTVPNLLLWGKFNSLFALLLIAVIYFNEFHLKEKIVVKA